MDEITIGEKIYVSSKRAAKITGYAKDYVGQLCREGRVEAKLVGRNWYVLEDSIKEHRFGKEEPVKDIPKTEEAPSRVATWEKPQYVQEQQVMVPNLAPKKGEDGPIGNAAVANMQSAWREWFQDREQKELPDGTADFSDEYLPVVIDQQTPVAPVSQPEVQESAVETNSEPVSISRVHSIPAATESFSEEVAVPLRRSYKKLESKEEKKPKVTSTYSKKTEGAASTLILRTVLLLVASLACLVSLVGTGYASKLLGETGYSPSVTGKAVDYLSGTSISKKDSI